MINLIKKKKMIAEPFFIKGNNVEICKGCESYLHSFDSCFLYHYNKYCLSCIGLIISQNN